MLQKYNYNIYNKQQFTECSGKESNCYTLSSHFAVLQLQQFCCCRSVQRSCLRACLYERRDETFAGTMS